MAQSVLLIPLGARLSTTKNIIAMKYSFYIFLIAVCLIASCSHPQLIFLNGQPIEGTPQEFIERSNYCGNDDDGNPIVFPAYDSTGVDNIINVYGIPSDEELVPFWVYFDTDERGQISKLRTEAIISEQDIPVVKEKAEKAHAQQECYLWDANSEPILYKIHLTYELK